MRPDEVWQRVRGGTRTAGVLLGMLVVVLAAFRTVKTGEVAVVTRFGQVTGRVLYPGANFIMPFVETTLNYNTKKITYETAPTEKKGLSNADYRDSPVDTNTKDGQPVDISYTVRFSVDPEKAKWIAQNIGPEEALVEKIVKTESRIWARNVPRNYSAEELYTGEGSIKVQDAIFEKLKPVFETNGLVLDTVGIREIVFDMSYVEAIKQKQVELVMIEVEKNKAAQEEFRKEQRITAAEGQAREQELQRLTINDALLRKLWIEKWDGKLPTYVGGGDTNTLMQLP
ncbi:MAG: membrane protease subunit, stomatin/prohibitin [Microgenomates group bacterium Gr01-1014_16]|nr:MAG: membrane protease subunit, stomatin/prohibitin [Microgenomates group bacterium Gr01-1014_16]